MPYQSDLQTYSRVIRQFTGNPPQIHFTMPLEIAPSNSNRNRYMFKIVANNGSALIIDGETDLFIELLDIFRPYLGDNCIRYFYDDEVVFKLDFALRHEIGRVHTALIEDYNAKSVVANNQVDNNLDALFHLHEIKTDAPKSKL